MNSTLHVPLRIDAAQTARLVALQHGFAELCNALMPVVEETRIWNRVVLHHLAYRDLRERFPAMGSQMVCNAIYSVSRTCRLLFQNPKSPFHRSRPDERPLPRVRFADTAPVYFDRHTLSVKSGRLSMFTLDGRMHFDLALRPGNEQALRTQRLREIVLLRRPDGVFELTFRLGDPSSQPVSSQPVSSPAAAGARIPDYLMLEEA